MSFHKAHLTLGTLFNALIGSPAAQAANFPFCTIDPNFGIVNVPDPRLDVLGRINRSEKVVPATMEFVDIAGIVKGASNGEGLGNKFLSNIRNTDAIVHVVRCFINVRRSLVICFTHFNNSICRTMSFTWTGR